ncbi:MAG: hypothetical protein JW989_03845, partial [Chlorobiaceae bacterium]|nr:hypothetical protein [Chlorobiaceae bacterium]
LRSGTDSARIYVMGLSNGGMMTHRPGIELGKKLAAIAWSLPTCLRRSPAVRSSSSGTEL